MTRVNFLEERHLVLVLKERIEFRQNMANAEKGRPLHKENAQRQKKVGVFGKEELHRINSVEMSKMNV